LDELRFRKELFLLREEFIDYVHNELYKEDKDFYIFDESEEDDLELYDNFYYPIDLYISCEDNVFIHTKEELYIFYFILLFLIFNGYFLLGSLYFLFGKSMAYVDIGDDTDIDDEPYYFTLEKYFQKAFTLLNRILKKREKRKDKSLFIIDSEELFDFIVDKNFNDNNINLYLSDIGLPKI